MTFRKFKKAVHEQFTALLSNDLFTSRANPDDIWEKYLNSFPEGTNPIINERGEYDCSACKSFIRNAGSVLAIVDDNLVSLWDIKGLEPKYQTVVDALSKFVKDAGILSKYLHTEKKVGLDFNNHMTEDGVIIKYEHFHYDLPRKLYNTAPASKIGDSQTNYKLLQRGLVEITVDSVDTVMELVQQKSLYRGEEHLPTLKAIKKIQQGYNTTPNRELYLWKHSEVLGEKSRFKNNVIGTLLVDLSNGVDLEVAVSKFESKVAPHNYKRPKALITQGMITKAENKVNDLGISKSLQRRYAETDDVTINDVIYADRSVKQSMGVFDTLRDSVADKLPNDKSVRDVFIDDFIETVIPHARSIEMWLDNNHINNMTSIIAPVNKDAPSLFKWDNGFSWSYNGEVTDSIKEKVKAAGGKVDGYFRCSLSWPNRDDLDIHMVEPNNNRIFHGNDYSRLTRGNLDVDMNVSLPGPNYKGAVENITYPNKNYMHDGEYTLKVHNYTSRESANNTFVVEVECGDNIWRFESTSPRDNETINVATFRYTKEKGIELVRSIPSTQSTREVWELQTQKYHTVSMVTNSPNHWHGNKSGNKHWFFILRDCNNPEESRGFYNEFLRDDLTEHRKVFEVLGSKMKVEPSNNQLSGLGFSSTQRNEVLCRVSNDHGVQNYRIKF